MNLKQHKFVTEFLRWGGDHVVAYKNAYNSSSTYKTLESAANRLLKNPEVAQAIEDAQASIRAQVQQEVAEQVKEEVLTLQHKRELLYKIATGNIWVEQNYKGKDCNVCTQYIRPTINQMLRAIHLDSKLANHYPQHVIAREYLPSQVRTKQPHETQTPPQETSPQERVVGVCSHAPENSPFEGGKGDVHSHRKTQNTSTFNEDRETRKTASPHPQTHPALAVTKKKPLIASGHPELDSGSSETQGNLHRTQNTPINDNKETITTQQLAQLLNTEIPPKKKPRIFHHQKEKQTV